MARVSDLGSCADECGPTIGWCWNATSTRPCARNYDADNCYDWGPEPLIKDCRNLGNCDAFATFKCKNEVSPAPAPTPAPTVQKGPIQVKVQKSKSSPITEHNVDLKVSYESGGTGYDEGIVVAPGQNFWLRWITSKDANAPKRCGTFGTRSPAPNASLWSSSKLAIPTGEQGPFFFTDKTFEGYHGFGLNCHWSDGKSVQDAVKRVYLDKPAKISFAIRPESGYETSARVKSGNPNPSINILSGSKVRIDWGVTDAGTANPDKYRPTCEAAANPSVAGWGGDLIQYFKQANNGSWKGGNPRGGHLVGPFAQTTNISLFCKKSSGEVETAVSVTVNVASTECSDGRDNDNDGKIDKNDRECSNASDTSEATR